MKAKIIGILVVTLLISAAFPAVGTINKIKNEATTSTHNSGIEWTKTYGEDEYDVFYDVDVTDDGYIMSGNREDNGYYHPYVLKVDSTGNQQWNWTVKEFEFNGTLCEVTDNWATGAKYTSDGKYAICLYITFEYEGDEILLGGLVKLDESGNFEWFSFLGEENLWWFIPTDLIEISDGFVVSGFGANIGDPANDHKAMLVKTDLSGIIQNYEFYNYGDYEDSGYAVYERNDKGGYILTGCTYNTPSESDYLVVITDPELNEVNHYTYGGLYNQVSYNHDCFQTEDGGVIMGGQGYFYESKSIDAWFVKSDSTGNMVWNRGYGCDNYTDTCWGFEKTVDNRYVFCVTMNFNGWAGDKDDTHLVMFDEEGKIVWIQVNGGPLREVGTRIRETPDGGFIVAGRNGMSYAKDADATLTKFAPFDNEQPDKPNKPAGKTRIKLDTEYTYKTSTSDLDGDQLYYKWDWGDGNQSGWLGPYNSEDTCEAIYSWIESDNYSITVMAKDTNGGESDWSDPLNITPRTRAYHDSLLLRLLERFPNIYLFFQKLLGL
jgi:hypothetical protein